MNVTHSKGDLDVSKACPRKAIQKADEMDLRHVKDSSAGQNEPEDVNDVLTLCTSDEDHSPVKKMPRIDLGEKRNHGLAHRASSESEESSPTVHGDIDVSISCVSGSQELDDHVDIFDIGMKETYSDFETSSDDHSDHLEGGRSTYY